MSPSLSAIFTFGVGVIFFYAAGVQLYLVKNQSKWAEDLRRQIM